MSQDRAFRLIGWFGAVFHGVEWVRGDRWAVLLLGLSLLLAFPSLLRCAAALDGYRLPGEDEWICTGKWPERAEGEDAR